MKILKYIGLGLAAIVALALIAGLFLPKDYDVSRTVTIERSNADVFEYARMIRNQEDYSVWWKMDPNQVNTYTGEDGSVGFVAAWKSELDSESARPRCSRAQVILEWWQYLLLTLALRLAWQAFGE